MFGSDRKKSENSSRNYWRRRHAGLRRGQFTLQAWFVLLILLGVGMLGLRTCYEALGPDWPTSVLRQIRPGMSKAEVIHILGQPTTIVSPAEWEYSRTGNVGWVDIYFDSNGYVHSVNDESAFP